MKWCLALAAALVLIGQSRAEQLQTNLQAQPQIAPAPTDRLLFPRDFARGCVDFEMAPPHNEVDLGFCQIQPSDPGYRADSVLRLAYTRKEDQNAGTSSRQPLRLSRFPVSTVSRFLRF